MMNTPMRMTIRAVTVVLLVVLGVDLIAWGFGPLTERYL